MNKIQEQLEHILAEKLKTIKDDIVVEYRSVIQKSGKENKESDRK